MKSTTSTFQTVAFSYMLMLFFVLCFCSCSVAPEYTIVFSEAKGIQKGDGVIYKDMSIGKVKTVEQKDAGTVNIRVSIEKKFARYVREKSAFIIRTKRYDDEVTHYVEMKVLDADSSPLSSGAIVRGWDTEMDLRLAQLKTNWKKNLIIVVTGIVILAASIILFKFLVRTFALIVSVAAALAGAAIFQRPVADYLSTILSPEYRPDIVAYVLLILGIYLLVVLLITALVKPLRRIA